MGIDTSETIYFNDKLGVPPRINAREWYWRATYQTSTRTFTVPWNTHCVCNKPYHPSKSRQRYCATCNKWFDIQCIGGTPEAKRVDYEMDEAVSIAPEERFEKMLDAPYVRGFNTKVRAFKYDGSNRWLVSGSGSWLCEAAAWGEDVPENWEDQLDPSFVSYCGETNWLWYKCPKCDCLV
jgi:hypothetical protein